MFDRIGVQRHVTARFDFKASHGKVGRFIGGEQHFHADPFSRFLRCWLDGVELFVQVHKIPYREICDSVTYNRI